MASTITVGELKKIIQSLPDDMKVGGIGHFGEFLECWDVTVTNARMGNGVVEEILEINIDNPGDEPD